MEGMTQTPTHTPLLHRSQMSHWLRMHDSFSHPRQRKHSLHQPPLCLTTETEGVSMLYIYFRSHMDFWNESPKHSHLLCFSLVVVQKSGSFSDKTAPEDALPEGTNTSQLVEMLWNKPWGQERTAGPDSSGHGSAAGDHVPQETDSKCYRQCNATAILVLCKSNIIW